jgi:hypothetical protein
MQFKTLACSQSDIGIGGHFLLNLAHGNRRHRLARAVTNNLSIPSYCRALPRSIFPISFRIRFRRLSKSCGMQSYIRPRQHLQHEIATCCTHARYSLHAKFSYIGLVSTCGPSNNANRQILRYAVVLTKQHNVTCSNSWISREDWILKVAGIRIRNKQRLTCDALDPSNRTARDCLN